MIVEQLEWDIYIYIYAMLYSNVKVEAEKTGNS